MRFPKGVPVRSWVGPPLIFLILSVDGSSIPPLPLGDIMHNQWYALRVMSGCEAKVKSLIEMSKDRHQLDLEEIKLITETIKARGKETNLNLYPGYLFLKTSLNRDAKNIICAIKNVIGFVGGRNPIPMSEEEMTKIIASAEPEPVLPEPIPLFVGGDLVRITTTGMVGRVSKVSGTRVVITTSLFDRDVETEVPATSLRKISQ